LWNAYKEVAFTSINNGFLDVEYGQRFTQNQNTNHSEYYSLKPREIGMDECDFEESPEEM
jgi:hypothetical protein|tara:strand:+ start:698 stop:877 length:180 start_codon:yes stop_codon:yes gene_type:complete